MSTIHVKHVLAPTDFSEPAALALDYAAFLARTLDARLTILHVLGGDIEVDTLSAAIQPAAAELQEHRTDAAMVELDSWAGRVDDLDVDILLKRGTPSVEIVRTAEEEGCDLIVLGARGRSAFRHMLFGSTAERVVRKAARPVLTVPGSLPDDGAGDD